MFSHVTRSLAVFTLLVSCTAPAAAAPHMGDSAPVIAVPGDKAGTTIDTAKYLGKPVYVNFFASWCGPCNDEAPLVKKLYGKYKSRGFVAIGIDELEDAKTAAAFAHKYGWTFPIGVDGDGKALGQYQSYGLPVHVFIDRKGKIGTFRLGQMEPDEIEDAIKKLL
jgi:thiol-disulfide isomerase/thioredoxin